MKLSLLGVLASLLGSGPQLAHAPAHVLVYGDSNSWGWTPQSTAFPTVRIAQGKRWPDVMAAMLGSRVDVSVDALSGRTVDVDYPTPVGTVPGQDFNGARLLPEAIAREMPLDVVVIMLGTNDLRSDLNRTPEQIGAGVRRLVTLVQGSAGGVLTRYPAPRVLVIVPPHVEDTSQTPIDAVMVGAREKSRRLAEAVRVALSGADVPVFDASVAVHVHGVDGIHMTADDHRVAGRAIAVEVARVLSTRPAAQGGQ